MLRTQNNRAHPLILVVTLNIEMAHTTRQMRKKKHRALRKNNAFQKKFYHMTY